MYDLHRLSDEVTFTLLGQAGPYTFLVGVHNPIMDLSPTWGYIATPSVVQTSPVLVEEELTGSLRDKRRLCWGPVSSQAMAEETLKNFIDWANQVAASDDDNEDPVTEA